MLKSSLIVRWGNDYVVLREDGKPNYVPDEMIDFCDEYLGGMNTVMVVLNGYKVFARVWKQSLKQIKKKWSK